VKCCRCKNRRPAGCYWWWIYVFIFVTFYLKF